MSGYLENPTPKDIATVAAAEFWQVIYANLSHLSLERKAMIYEHAKKAAITEAGRCFPRVTNQKPLD